jgi:hypothetical protein
VKQALLNLGGSIFLVMIELAVAAVIVAPRWVARQLRAAVQRQFARIRRALGALIPDLARGRPALHRPDGAR